MDGRCATCTHWNHRDDPRISGPNDWDLAECVRMRHDGTSPVDRTTLASAFSTVEEDATVFTQRIFGCVMYSRKDP